jgi:hypothetical protein
METELLTARGSTVKVLGVNVNFTPRELRILVNGQDITAAMMIEELRIVAEKQETM